MISKAQIKLIRSLHLKKNRKESGLFIAEGEKVVAELLKSRKDMLANVFAMKEFTERYRNDIRTANCKTEEISEKELAQISTLSAPNLVLAVCRVEETVMNAAPKGFHLYLDDIRDPGNFGTLIRLADWFGMKELFCSPSSCELYNPKVLQASMGSFMRVRVHYAGLSELKVKNIYGAVMDGKSVYTSRLHEGLLVIGNEANGISAENRKLITEKISIPSFGGGAESLNAAMAASIIVSEYFRDR